MIDGEPTVKTVWISPDTHEELRLLTARLNSGDEWSGKQTYGRVVGLALKTLREALDKRDQQPAANG